MGLASSRRRAPSTTQGTFVPFEGVREQPTPISILRVRLLAVPAELQLTELAVAFPTQPFSLVSSGASRLRVEPVEPPLCRPARLWSSLIPIFGEAAVRWLQLSVPSG